MGLISWKIDMLILTRNAGEKLVIDDDIVVALLAVKGNQVLIGVDAPREVPVHREEVYLRMLDERAGEIAEAVRLHRRTG